LGNFPAISSVLFYARTADVPRDIPAASTRRDAADAVTKGATMRLARAFFSILSIICSPVVWAGDDTPSQAKVVVLATDAALSGAVTNAAPSDTKHIRGFFGYLEFDLDPHAPGGVPGFGAISESTPTTAGARSD
jgi:hypothetical protein